MAESARLSRRSRQGKGGGGGGGPRGKLTKASKKGAVSPVLILSSLLVEMGGQVGFARRSLCVCILRLGPGATRLGLSDGPKMVVTQPWQTDASSKALRCLSQISGLTYSSFVQ